MKMVLFGGLSLALVVLPALSQAANAPFNAAQRQAQIDRIRDGLNSPDPSKRLVTLEQAMAAKDAVIRRVALSTAFTSADSDLRSTALAAAIGSVATFVVDITGTTSTNDSSRSAGLTKILGPSFEVRIEKFDRSNNTFQASTSASGTNSNSPITHPGAVSGDRLSFEVDVQKNLGNGTTCSGVARLQGGNAVLKGSMTCNGTFDRASYYISVDVLK